MKKILLLLTLLYCSQEYAQCWQKISRNDTHTLVIKSDGTLWGWGQNLRGQLGDNTLIDKYSLIQCGIENNWASVCAGYHNSTALKTNGTLWTWGFTYTAVNGDGTGYSSQIPIQVGTDNDWQYLGQSPYNQRFIIKGNGTLWTWGYNTGQGLGLGLMPTSTLVTSPTQIGSGNDWIYVCGSGVDTFAIKSNHTLWGWGLNYYGELGDGTTVTRSSPVQIGTDSDWDTVIPSTNYKTLGKKLNGTLWIWGKSNNNIPTQIGNDNDWNKISNNGGGDFFVATKNNGTLWSWGDNGYGQLGDGTFIAKTIPTQISGSDWESVFAGPANILATKSNSIWTWGLNQYGMLGNGTTVNTNIPGSIPGLPCILLSNEVFNESNSFSLYPNPATNVIHIQNPINLPITKILITDLTFKRVYHTNQNLSEINIEQLAKGIYVIEIQSLNTKFYYKFFKI